MFLEQTSKFSPPLLSQLFICLLLRVLTSNTRSKMATARPSESCEMDPGWRRGKIGDKEISEMSNSFVRRRSSSFSLVAQVSLEASVVMQRLSYPTETVLSNKNTRNTIVLSFKDSPRNPLRRRPLVRGKGIKDGMEGEERRKGELQFVCQES